MINGLRIFGTDNLEMTSIESNENPLQFALSIAIGEKFSESEVLIDGEDILIATADDLQEYRSNVSLKKWERIFENCIGRSIDLIFELSDKNRLNFQKLVISKVI